MGGVAVAETSFAKTGYGMNWDCGFDREGFPFVCLRASHLVFFSFTVSIH